MANSYGGLYIEQIFYINVPEKSTAAYVVRLRIILLNMVRLRAGLYDVDKNHRNSLHFAAGSHTFQSSFRLWNASKNDIVDGEYIQKNISTI